MMTSQAYKAHIDKLTELALAGDEVAVRSLCAIALLIHGWRPDGDGGESAEATVIDIRDFITRLAA